MRLRGLLAGALLAAALVTTASAETYLPNQWRASAPFTVVLINVSVTDPILKAGLEASAVAWSAADAVDVVMGTRGKYTVKVYADFYPTGYGMAWTDVVSQGGKGYIQTVSIHFNMSLMTVDSTFQGVACHEIGHALGLDHVEDPAILTCMAPGPTSPLPDASDFANLALRY